MNKTSGAIDIRLTADKAMPWPISDQGLLSSAPRHNTERLRQRGDSRIIQGVVYVYKNLNTLKHVESG